MRTASMWSLACSFFFKNQHHLYRSDDIFQCIASDSAEEARQVNQVGQIAWWWRLLRAPVLHFYLPCENFRAGISEDPSNKLQGIYLEKKIFPAVELSKMFLGSPGAGCQGITTVVADFAGGQHQQLDQKRTRCLGSVQRNRGSCCCADFALSSREIN